MRMIRTKALYCKLIEPGSNQRDHYNLVRPERSAAFDS